MFYVKYDFSSNAKVFPVGNIFLIVKIVGFFYNRTYMSKRPFCNILMTVWFNKSISFSISSLFGTISGDFDIFLLFFWRNGMNACDSSVTVNYIVEVENGSNRWISTMKFKGANHDGLPQCSPLIETGKSHAFRS